MKFRIILIVISQLLLSSCNLIPCSSTSGLSDLENKISEKELTGDYKLDDWTKKLIPELENSNGKLLIKKNGQIELVNLPSAVFDDFDDGERLINYAKGNWKFPQKYNTNEIITELVFDKEFDSLNNIVRYWKIFSQDGKLTILIEFGDPDNCTVARFVKI